MAAVQVRITSLKNATGQPAAAPKELPRSLSQTVAAHSSLAELPIRRLPPIARPQPATMRQAAAFTLLEMLVATGIFMFGFAAAYSLFLVGMHARQEAESLTRASLAANALLDEFKLSSGLETNAPVIPNAYLGDGFAEELPGANPATATNQPDTLYPYKPLPNTWYCVTNCTDLTGGQDKMTTTLHLTLVVVPIALSDNANPVKIRDLWRRFSIQKPTSGQALTETDVVNELVRRGLAFRFHSALLRRASWLPRG